MRKNDEPAEGRPWWALWTLLLISPFYFLAAHFGYGDIGIVALIFMVTIGVALAAHWNARRHAMFWVAGVVLVLIHTALVVLLPWPEWKMNGPEFTPFGFLDFLANFAVVRWMVVSSSRRR